MVHPPCVLKCVRNCGIFSLQAFQAVSGKDGSLLWNFESQEAKNDIMNLYTAQIIKDLDGDGTVDVLAIHGGDPLQDPGEEDEWSNFALRPFL